MMKDFIKDRSGELIVGPVGLQLTFSTNWGTAEESLPRGHWTDEDRVGIYSRVIRRFADLVLEDRTPLSASEWTYIFDDIREIDALLGR